VGIGKLALSLNPVAMVVDQTVGMPGMAKGELGATQLAAGKALIAYDTWGEDPARASGAVVGNVLGAVIGTKGAGAAIKGSGTAAKVGGAASRTFPKTAELAANIGGKAGDLKINVASTLNTKITSLGEKIAIPKFGPQPALAGAGGRGSSVFEMTPGTRNGSSGAGVAARIDDGTPPAGTRAGSTGGASTGVNAADAAATSGSRAGGGFTHLSDEATPPNTATSAGGDPVVHDGSPPVDSDAGRALDQHEPTSIDNHPQESPGSSGPDHTEPTVAPGPEDLNAATGGPHPPASFGQSETANYRQTWQNAHPETAGKVVVHHAVEQQTTRRYPGLVSPNEMHSLENLRGVPKGDVNNRVHLSAIRKEWNAFYEENPHPTKQDLLDMATRVDDKYGDAFIPPIR